MSSARTPGLPGVREDHSDVRLVAFTDQGRIRSSRYPWPPAPEGEIDDDAAWVAAQVSRHVSDGWELIAGPRGHDTCKGAEPAVVAFGIDDQDGGAGSDHLFGQHAHHCRLALAAPAGDQDVDSLAGMPAGARGRRPGSSSHRWGGTRW
jgi:hypothetical protein